MERHAANASQVAQFLRGHPAVARVLYPGLPDHPGYQLAARQMKGFGGMVSVVLKGGGRAARAVASATRVFTLATSLGGLDALGDKSVSMTPVTLDGSRLKLAEGLLR